MTKVSKEAIKAAMGPNAIDAAVDVVFRRQDAASSTLLDHARLIETYEPERLIDPDLLEARRIVADHVTHPNLNVRTLNGENDDMPIVRAVLAALKSRPKP